MAEPEEGAEVRIDPLVELAKSTFLTRRMRRDLFDADLFGEPAWDILLVLYASSGAKGLHLTDLAGELETPVTIIRRWLAILESRGLVDPAGHVVQLSAKGRQNLRHYLKRQVASLTALVTANDNAMRH